MGTLSIRLPNSPHQRLAEREGISINQLVSSALAEKLSALDAERYLRERADVVAALRSMPSGVAIDAILSKVPDVERV